MEKSDFKRKEESKESKEKELSREINRIRAGWLMDIKIQDSVEKAFELELCLKAIDRFFNVKNLPLPDPEQAIAMNFFNELSIILDYVNRVIELSKELMEASRGSQMFQFRRFVESTLMSDVGRARIREASFEQKTPNESLFLLYTGFINLRGILRALLKSKKVPYSLFVNVGNFINREVISNRFFNPVGAIEFRPEFDRIDNRKISGMVMSIPDEGVKRHFSMTLLIFFRLLRYLNYINSKTNRLELLRKNLPIFSLIRSDSVQLADYMERILAGNLKSSSNSSDPIIEDFLKVSDAISFQLSMELKKIYRSELLGATRTEDPFLLRGAVENSQGIIGNYFQQSIIQLVKLFEPQIEGRDIFKFYTSKLRQSLQLRNDVWVMKELMERFEEQAETNPEEDTTATYKKYFKILRDYILYFRHESYNLLRFDDMREFNNFFDFMAGLSSQELNNPIKLNDFIFKSKYFKIFLETTLGNITFRNELKTRPIDYKACERFLKEFIVASMRKHARRLEQNRQAAKINPEKQLLAEKQKAE